MGDQIDTTYIALAVFAVFGFVLFLGFLGLVVLMVRHGLKRKQSIGRRAAELEAMAGAAGMNYTRHAPLSAMPFFASIEIFEGSPSSIENLMTGARAGVNFAVFDLAYSNIGAAGSGQTTSRQTMCAVEMRGAQLPRFYVRPEGILEKALHFAGRTDIDFDTHPAFSTAFTLFGDDEAAIRRLFAPPVLSFFERSASLAASGTGPYLVVFRSRYVAYPKEIEGYISTALAIAELFRGSSTS